MSNLAHADGGLRVIEILMVDDHTIFRSGLRRLLSDEPDMRIVAEAGNGREALEHLRRRPFGLLLLDVDYVGSRKALALAIANDNPRLRHTGLCERLRKVSQQREQL